jgi:ribosome-binding ATPase YchF (GTP1/OBG family)
MGADDFLHNILVHVGHITSVPTSGRRFFLYGHSAGGQFANRYLVRHPERVIAAGYGALDLITFLTTGEDESRAWEVRRGATAPEAAAAIHTDLQRGFIRAEVIPYDELVAAGSMDAAKAAGKVRVEGKDYVVREGDVLHVRFAV